MTAAGRFWACYLAGLVALGLASCAPPARAADLAPGMRCMLHLPRTAPARVELLAPQPMTDGRATLPGWSIRPDPTRPDLFSVWFAPAAQLLECQA